MSEGLRTELRHLRVKPLNALAFLTYRCTSKCKTCNIWKRTSDDVEELSKESWLRVLSQLKRVGIKSFEIFGGDALLRKDAIFGIIKFCNENGIHTHFPTNGNLCDRETVRELINSGLYTIYFSIDDIGEDHDYIRGSHGTYNRVKDAFEMFVEIRGNSKFPKIIICTTLSNMNYRNFPRLVEFIENYEIDAIYPRIVGEFRDENVKESAIDRIFPEPNYTSDDSSNLFSYEQLRELKDIVNQIKRSNYQTYINFRALDVAEDRTFLSGEYIIKNCHIATSLVTVTPNGDITPCPFFTSYIIGNLTKHDLIERWGSTAHRKFIDLQQKKQLAICKNCNLRVYYPSMAENLIWEWKRAFSKMK